MFLLVFHDADTFIREIRRQVFSSILTALVNDTET